MKPKGLLFDIESTFRVGSFWGQAWETSINEVIEQTQVLSYSAKWLGGRHVTKGWPDYPGYKPKIREDTKIVQDIHKLFNEADFVVAHNGRRFDFKVVNSRFAFHGLKPPQPYKTVDTLVEAKKHFDLPSYKLDFICDYFGIGRKLPHQGFPMWKGCIAGNKKDWATMLRYNKHDILLLEGVYKLLLPYMATHPNYNLFAGTLDRCPNCGGNIQRRGFRVSRVSRFQRFECQGCGAWSSKPSSGVVR